MKGLYVIAFVGICFALASAGRRHRKPVVCSISGAVTESRECPMETNCTAGPVSIFIREQNAEVNFCQKDDSSEEQETDEIQKRLSKAIVRSACKVFNESHTLFEKDCMGENMECTVTITLNIGDQTVAAKYCKNTTADEFSYLKAFTGQRRDGRPDSDMLRPNCSDEDEERSNEKEERPNGGRDGRKGGHLLSKSSESDESSMEADIEQPTEMTDRLAQFRAQRIQAALVSRSSEEDSSDESRSDENERPASDIERPEASIIVGENVDKTALNAARSRLSGRQDRPERPRQNKQPARLDSASNSESMSNEDSSNSDSSEEDAVDGPALEEPVVEFRPDLEGGRASRYRIQSRRQE